MQTEEWQGIARWRAHQPIFGRLSLWVLVAAAVITSLLVLVAFIAPASGDCVGSLKYLALGLYLGGAMCIVNVGIALTGLARKETPLRPAITGLILSVPPALGGVHLLCDVQSGQWLLLGMGAVAVFLVAIVRFITHRTIQHFFPKSVP